MRRGAFWLLGAVGLGVAIFLWLSMVCSYRGMFGPVSDFFCGPARPGATRPRAKSRLP